MALIRTQLGYIVRGAPIDDAAKEVIANEAVKDAKVMALGTLGGFILGFAKAKFQRKPLGQALREGAVGAGIGCASASVSSEFGTGATATVVGGVATAAMMATLVDRVPEESQ